MAAFSDSVEQGVAQLLQNLAGNCDEIVSTLMVNIIQATPVIKGQLINSWYPAIGDTPDSISVTDSFDSQGGDSIERVSDTITPDLFLGKDNTVTMTNNEDYAWTIEYLGVNNPHWQRPEGMLRTSVDDMQNLIGG